MIIYREALTRNFRGATGLCMARSARTRKEILLSPMVQVTEFPPRDTMSSVRLIRDQVHIGRVTTMPSIQIQLGEERRDRAGRIVHVTETESLTLFAWL